MTCRKCFSPDGDLVIFVLDGADVAEGILCHRCQEAGAEGLASWRSIFEALLESGVDRASANRRVIEMMDAEVSS